MSRSCPTGGFQSRCQSKAYAEVCQTGKIQGCLAKHFAKHFWIFPIWQTFEWAHQLPSQGLARLCRHLTRLGLAGLQQEPACAINNRPSLQVSLLSGTLQNMQHQGICL